MSSESLYAAAGVDIDRAQNLLGSVKQRIESTRRPEVLKGVGSFGGLFQLDISAYKAPVLVSSIDGVGTKLMVAELVGRHDSVGHDLVNHCINDIAVQGAEPLYFMDYLGIGKLRSPLYEDVLGGLADACATQNVTLLGGETAEMPGMYGDDFDLVGSIVGVVDRDKIITGDAIQTGDKIIGLASSGLHTNGYSLARKALFEQAKLTVDSRPEGLGESVGDALLQPHVCYWPAIRAALAAGLPLHGMAHITGGGFYDNVPRVLPDNCQAAFDAAQLPAAPAIFELIQEAGDVSTREMYRVFNMGVGMMWILPEASVPAALELCQGQSIDAQLIGDIVSGDAEVVIHGIDD